MVREKAKRIRINFLRNRQKVVVIKYYYWKKACAAVAHAFFFCLYIEQIGMGAGPVEIKCITFYAVYEQPIWGNMAFPSA